MVDLGTRPAGRAPASELHALREEIARLLAAALDSDEQHVAAVRSAEAAHHAVVKHLEEDHLVELLRQRMTHDDEMANLHAALVTRDVIGQAKGIIIAAMHCSADAAFDLLVRQSQHENRKVVAIAKEVTERAQHRAGRG